MAFPSVSHPCLPLRSPWDPVSISRTDHLSLSLWRVHTGVMESSKRQSDRPVPTEWHSALLHGDRTRSRYWGGDNKLQTRAGDGKLSHPEMHGECCKAKPGQGKI